MVNIMNCPFYTWEKSPQWPLNGRLDKPPQWVWLLWRTDKSLAPSRNQNMIHQ